MLYKLKHGLEAEAFSVPCENLSPLLGRLLEGSISASNLLKSHLPRAGSELARAAIEADTNSDPALVILDNLPTFPPYIEVAGAIFPSSDEYFRCLKSGLWLWDVVVYDALIEIQRRKNDDRTRNQLVDPHGIDRSFAERSHSLRIQIDQGIKTLLDNEYVEAEYASDEAYEHAAKKQEEVGRRSERYGSSCQ